MWVWQVLDENDNAPRLSAGPRVNESVQENRPKGLRVLRVVALDPDAGENGTVRFYMEAGGWLKLCLFFF